MWDFPLTSLRDIKRIRPGSLVPGSEYAFGAMLSWGIYYTAIGTLSKQMGWAYPTFITVAGSAILLYAYLLAKGERIRFPKKSHGLLSAWILIGTAALVFYGIGTSYGYLSLSLSLW